MSRVIVKGMPPTAGKAQLRAMLAPFADRTGALTDVRCARTGGGGAGRSRGFAFVGFREARGAVFSSGAQKADTQRAGRPPAVEQKAAKAAQSPCEVS